MLDSLDRGGWEVRYRDGSAARKVCVRTGREFIQLRHSDSGCNRNLSVDRATPRLGERSRFPDPMRLLSVRI